MEPGTDPPCLRLPPEIWREIVRYATEDTSSLLAHENSDTFGWTYESKITSSHYESFITKRNLALVCKQFYEIAEEFLYEAVYIRCAEQAIHLAVLCENASTSNVLECLKTYTKELHVVLAIEVILSDADAEFVDLSLQALVTIVNACKRLEGVLVRADSTTLFLHPTYQPWVVVLAALPHTLKNLNVQNFLLGPVAWTARLFDPRTSIEGTGINLSETLQTLKLEAEHPPIELSFPCLTHLWVFSWPTASLWDLPVLTHLYIAYFPGNDSTSSFWIKPQENFQISDQSTNDTLFFQDSSVNSVINIHPQIKLLHFGPDTDFGLYHSELPMRLQTSTPRLQKLEYYLSGDLEVMWDPKQLPEYIKKVTIKTFGYYELSEIPNLTGRPRVPSASSYIFSSPYDQAENEMETQKYTRDAFTELLTVVGEDMQRRWGGIRRHLESYRDDVDVEVLLPVGRRYQGARSLRDQDL